MSRDRAQDWGANDTIEEGYLDKSAADKRVYESDPTDKPDLSLQRAPLSNHSLEEVIGLERQLTEGKANRTLNPLEENHCRTHRIRLHFTMDMFSENWI